ncbi:hypothetical protein AB4Z18_13705 [Leifsonia sp. 2TAF2]|uniref:hypothetical protein n=1 Tax=Leifsonia sp. 2TAF2 TaxID=3233009 RepID=UPI003F9C3362
MVIDIVREALGWAGSVLLVVSLLQSRMLALRVLNLVAALLLIAYNIALAVWPSVAMNVAVALIDAYYLLAPSIRRIRRRGATVHPRRSSTRPVTAVMKTSAPGKDR